MDIGEKSALKMLMKLIAGGIDRMKKKSFFITLRTEKDTKYRLLG